MPQGLSLKINVRHTDNGNKVKTVTRINNAEFNLVFNSIGSTFSFDYFFDPDNQEDAEVVCVSHMHEAQWYYNDKLFLTGYILSQQFIDNGKQEWVKISGYSKSASINKCWTPPGDSLETEGLTFRQIIEKTLQPWKSNGIGIKYGTNLGAQFNQAFTSPDKEKDPEDELDESISKSSKDVSQNVGSYLSDLAKRRGIVMSHDEFGNIRIKKPNTKGTPIINLDYSDNKSDAFKIPSIGLDFTFNGESLHTHITIVQQADENSGTNASEVTKKNPLIPIKQSVIYWPITHVVDSGSDSTVGQSCNYEMGLEVREAAKFKIDLGTAVINNNLIKPDNVLTIKKRSIFAYNKINLFIESVTLKFNSQSDTGTSTLNCVLPFGYDFDFNSLKNVWVDPHENLPRGV
jgi:hypothetical protein